MGLDSQIAIGVVARLEEFEKTMATMPGIAGKDAKLVASEINKSLKAAEKASKDAAKAAVAAGKASAEAATLGTKGWSAAGKDLGFFAGNLKKVGTGMSVVAPGLGGAVKDLGKFANVGKVATSVASGLGVSVEALAAAAPVALGVAALGAAAIASVAAIGALGYGLVEAGLSAHDALTELQGFKYIDSAFYPEVPPAAIASFDRLAASGDAVTSILDRLTVNVGSSTAPELEHLTDIALGLGLKAEGMFEVWSAGKDLFVEMDKVVQDSIINAFMPEVDALRAVGRAYLDVSDLVGHKYDPALKAAFASNAGLRDAIVASDVAMLGSIDSTGALAAAGKKLLDEQIRATAAVKDHAKATADDVKAEKEREKAELDLAKTMAAASDTADGILAAAGEFRLSETAKLANEQADAMLRVAEAAKAAGRSEEEIAREVAEVRTDYDDRITNAVQAGSKKRIEATEAELKKAKEAAAKQRDAWLGALSSTVQAVDSLSDSFAHTYKTSTAEGRKAAEKQWKTMHTLQLASATVLAAVAIAQANASAPYPYNIPSIIASAATGAAEVAAIAVQKPSFHAGGLAPDEMNARVLKRELVINQQGVSTFDQGRRANAGMSQAPSMVAVSMRLRHEVVDRVTAEVYQRGGQLQRAISGQQSGPPFGHRRDLWRK